MKVHILPGRLESYYRNGGRFDAANPDPGAIVTELPGIPQQGQFVVYRDPHNDDTETVARVDNVVLVESVNVFVFVTP